jgi:hypothetical protein
MKGVSMKKLLLVAMFTSVLSVFLFVTSRDEAMAQCVVDTTGATYGQGYSARMNLCDTLRNVKVTLGTLLNTEVPATPLSYISVGTTEDKHTVKDTPGSLFSITATNSNAAVRYLKCENDTSANTAPGTDTPEWRFAIPAAVTGGHLSYTPPFGVSFIALTCWIVTGAADSDVTEAAANEVMVNYSFK